MKKITYFFIDDVIFTFRNIAQQRPKSLFDDPFMAVLKKAHDTYGTTVQLNLFYRTDFFYGSKEFTLAEFPDCYKAEFEANADWLRLAFHAKQEFPDYPYPNADYEDVVADCTAVRDQIFRFAGEQSFSRSVVMHWGAMSKEGCKALVDCGVKFMSPSYGEIREYNGDPASLPYGHAFRLLQNRKPETRVFTRNTNDKAILNSICSHNYLPFEIYNDLAFKDKSYLDEETGIRIRQLGGAPCLNRYKLEDLEKEFAKVLGNEFVGIGNHEQYFYSDYYAYQPDYADKIMLMSKIMTENGYTFVRADQLQ